MSAEKSGDLLAWIVKNDARYDFFAIEAFVWFAIACTDAGRSWNITDKSRLSS